MMPLYIAWQDPETRSWHPVGRLTREDGPYRFVYTRGALVSQRFGYLGRMRDLHKSYVSEDLFPLFANRLLGRARPEYPEYLHWLAVGAHESDPIRLLARSGGYRATDRLCVYPQPEGSESGEVTIFFFSHGLHYLDPESLQRLARLTAGERLTLRHHDVHQDRHAPLLESEETVGVGYCPRYLTPDLHQLLKVTGVRVTVEQVNRDAPLQFRLLCKATFTPPAGFELFVGEAYQPLAKEAEAA